MIAPVWTSGALAWWRVRDPVLTPVHPYDIPVRVTSDEVRGRVRVEVEHVPGCVRDPARLPGERFTVTTRKITPRVR